MITITDNQMFDVAVSAVSAKGNVAAVENIQWTVSDDALLTITSEANQATVSAVGPVGQAQVRVTADADLGEGVRPINGVLDVEIIGGEAVALELAPTNVREQAAA